MSLMRRCSMRWLGCFGVICGWVLTAGGAVLYTEAWDATDAGWYGRSGVASVSHAGGFGNPAGSMVATFAEQGIPAPEVDAFRANSGSSGGAFTGNYWADLGTFYGWTFSFYAMNVMPSDLQIRFQGSSGPTFLYNATAQLGGVGSWYTITVPGTYAGNWFGGTEAAWSNALGGVTFVDIQIARSATGAQESYYLDNFRHNYNPPPPPPSGMTPEPGTGILILVGAALVFRSLRREGKVTPLSS